MGKGDGIRPVGRNIRPIFFLSRVLAPSQRTQARRHHALKSYRELDNSVVYPHKMPPPAPPPRGRISHSAAAGEAFSLSEKQLDAAVDFLDPNKDGQVRDGAEPRAGSLASRRGGRPSVV